MKVNSTSRDMKVQTVEKDVRHGGGVEFWGKKIYLFMCS